MKTESKKAQLDEKYQQWRGFFPLATHTRPPEEVSPYLQDVRALVDYITMLKALLANSEREHVWNWNSFFIGLIPFMLLLIYLLVNH